jgi:RecG-like helicase
MNTATNIINTGHNLLLTGQAGTGKTSFLVATIKKLVQQGKEVVVLCPTGIAATQFQHCSIAATTVHRYRYSQLELPTLVCFSDTR